jgi:hypothetical protein
VLFFVLRRSFDSSLVMAEPILAIPIIAHRRLSVPRLTPQADGAGGADRSQAMMMLEF